MSEEETSNSNFLERAKSLVWPSSEFKKLYENSVNPYNSGIICVLKVPLSCMGS